MDGHSKLASRLVAAALASLSVLSAAAQTPFVDDADRSVVLPERVSRVFAAGAPAEVLLYTLVPEMLVGRNHLPSAEAQAFMPAQYRTPIAITNLPDRDDPENDRELLALDPDVYVDYGDVDPDYVGALEAISARTEIPGIILDGRLTNIPTVYRELGAAFGVPERGERLAREIERLFDKYRGSADGVRVYLACSANLLTPCVSGHSSGEAAELLGAINVAGSIQTAPQRQLTGEEIVAFAPEVIIVSSPAALAALREDPGWGDIPAVANRRVHLPPDLPFNWGPRPPSVNRLPGMIWMSYVLRGQSFDDEFYADIGAFFETFYHVRPTEQQLRALVEDWRGPRIMRTDEPFLPQRNVSGE